VRTLHHYDTKEVLCPCRNLENSYREYTNKDMDKLQQILFFKECGFSLEIIKEPLNSKTFDRKHAFEIQKKYLLHEKKRINVMLKTIEKSISSMKGELTMSQKDKFKGFDLTNNPYKEEARALWGNEPVDKSSAYISSLSKANQNKLSTGMDSLFTELAKVKNESPASKTVQNEIDKMYRFFNANFGYNYSLKAFASVGQLYIADERFKENIDKYGSRLSVFLAEAMKIYTETAK